MFAVLKHAIIQETVTRIVFDQRRLKHEIVLV